MEHKKFFVSVSEMQADLYTQYNTRRPHQGRLIKGRTPQQMFAAGKRKTRGGEKPKKPPKLIAQTEATVR